jgi:fucose permease
MPIPVKRPGFLCVPFAYSGTICRKIMLTEMEASEMTGLLLAIIYLSFISLGLPDALLGAAWPAIYPQLDVPLSYMGIIALLISAGTVVSSLLADRLICRFGTGKVTAFSVAATAAALLGFFLSGEFWMLLLWALPYGLGAGCVDAALNNYVAVHYASRHMNWLHCMWGIGAATGPYIMGFALTAGQTWNMGYLYIAILQIGLTGILLLSLPIWKGSGRRGAQESGSTLTFSQILKIPGVKKILVTFFCYCALEQTTGQWASSYLVMWAGFSAREAASLGSLFYIGITAGRALSGFLTLRLNDTQMIRLGQLLIGTGILLLLLPLGEYTTIAALVILGLGCAPIYPSIIHATPERFGAHRSQAVIGIQMAFAYVGNCLMPPLFGLAADWLGVWLLPVYLGGILALMVIMHEGVVRACRENGR